MKLFRQMDEVRAAQARVAAHRAEMATPAAALLARGHRYPLATVGAAAGAGFVLGRLNVHPLRLPGLGALLSGGFAEIVAHGTRLLAELAAAGDDTPA